MTDVRDLYLGTGSDAAFAMFHPAPGADMRTGMVICPPFGWHETASHRGLRDWAEASVAAGCPVIRLDFPGTGDAGGSPRDTGRLDAWTRAADRAARWLRAESGCGRVVAIGLGVGGLVAVRAAALEDGIDDLVLWAVPARGRTMVREMKAFARLNADESAVLATDASRPDDGSMETGGFHLSAQTLDELGGLDLTELALPRPTERRALLLERDGIEPDERLRDHLENIGVTVEVAPGDGYGALTAGPQESRFPSEAVAATLAWLAATPDLAPHPATSSDVPAAHSSVEMEIDGRRVRERPFAVEQPCGLLRGVLTEPLEGGTADLRGLLLNAGAVRRTGPSRLWVEFARRWAARGVTTLRLDTEAIGDSDGSRDYTDNAALYTPDLVAHVSAAMDALDASLGSRDRPRYLVAGLCSGAYWGFHAALRDDRVRSLLMLNPRALYWHEKLEVARAARRAMGGDGGRSWKRLLTGQVSAERMRAGAAWFLRAPAELRRAARERQRLEAAFDQLRNDETRVLLIFGENEPLDDELERDGITAQPERWPNMELAHIPGEDHILRPLLTQERVHALVDRALDGGLDGQVQPDSTVPAGLRAT